MSHIEVIATVSKNLHPKHNKFLRERKTQNWIWELISQMVGSMHILDLLWIIDNKEQKKKNR